MNDKTIVVLGATGRMGGAAARHLHRSGWKVRGVSRNPQSEASQQLVSQGIEVVHGDLDKPSSLQEAFQDAYGVFLVVNGWDTGPASEVRQGKIVADVAAEARIKQLVFGAAGTGDRGTGIAHFDSKLDIEDYLKEKQVPTTVIFPPVFMELMTDPTLYPQAGMWNIKIKIVGEGFQVPWIATDDIGGLAAVIFSQPEKYLGKRLKPVGDWKSPGECRQIYQEIAGKKPSRWPMPVWVLRKMQPDLVKMWEWMRDTKDLSQLDLQDVSSIHAKVTNVRTFLQGELSGTA